MDRQKTIPPLSTKITRKLAQESADHNSLMNFYSSISRDETGAPKKWKMSAVPINEDAIAGAKANINVSRGNASTSRDSSGERKIKSSPGVGSKLVNSLPDSSLENKDKSRSNSVDTALKRLSSGDSKTKDQILTGKGRRSVSAENTKKGKMLPQSTDSFDKLENMAVKKKRGRPKSLDLSLSKAANNVDDESFKSPDPLTPCNVAVKRRKGRPKETPPTLVAESPVEQTNMDDDNSDSEIVDESEIVLKKKPGRKPKNIEQPITDNGESDVDMADQSEVVDESEIVQRKKPGRKPKKIEQLNIDNGDSDVDMADQSEVGDESEIVQKKKAGRKPKKIEQPNIGIVDHDADMADQNETVEESEIVQKKKPGRKSKKIEQLNTDDVDSDADIADQTESLQKKKPGRPKRSEALITNSIESTAANDVDAVVIGSCELVKKKKPRGQSKKVELGLTEGINPNSDLSVDNLQKKKAGRPSKKGTGKLIQQKSTLKVFGVKKYDGIALKKYRSKLVKKSTALTGYNCLPHLAKIETDVSIQKNDENDESPNEKESSDNVESIVKENSTTKRKSGRPPGAKNRKSVKPTLKGPRKQMGRPVNLKKRQYNRRLIQTEVKKKGGRPRGSKNKPKPLVSPLPAVDAASSTEIQPALKLDNIDQSLVVEKEIKVPSSMSTLSEKLIEETIESVIKNAQMEEISDNPAKMQDPLRSVGLKNKGGVKSLAKLKKESNIVRKANKKRILMSHSANSDSGASISHLATNDLRRKLHRKLIAKLGGNRAAKVDSSSVVVADGDETLNKLSTEKAEMDAVQNAENYETKLNSTDAAECVDSIFKGSDTDIQNLSALIEQKRVTKNDMDGVIEPKKRMGRIGKPSIDQKDFSKFSDSESICSEVSTISALSFGSARKPFEKQILVLGEDNTDSDENAVRTRQRFEIIPGKKRKRTLSGEFDLLDEKQLRKERKCAEQALSADDADEMQNYDEMTEVRKKKLVKRSPQMKVKRGRVEKPFSSPFRTAHRMKLFKQSLLKPSPSPYLSRIRKKRNALWQQVNKISVELKSKTVDKSELCEFNEKNQENEKKVKLGESELSETNMCDSSPVEKNGCKVEPSAEGENRVTYHVESEQKPNDERNEKDAHKVKNEDIELKPDEHVDMKMNSEKNDCKNKGEEVVEKGEMKNKKEIVGELKSEKKSGIINEDDEKKDIEVQESKLEQTIIVGNIDNIKEKDDEIEKDNGNNDVDTFEIKSEIESNVHMILLDLIDKVVVDNNDHTSEKSDDISVDELHNEDEKLNRKLEVSADALQKNKPRTFKKRKRRGPKPKVIKKETEEKTIKVKPIAKKARKTSPGKDSPESGVIRKIELRQKISRSPLDNIALKQSIEENEYIKSEAQKASKKEAKLRSKRAAAIVSQEAVEDIANTEEIAESTLMVATETVIKDATAVEVTTNEGTNNELSDTGEDHDVAVEKKVKTIEELLKDCKPCSVIVTDFIKQLQLNQSKLIQDDDNYTSSEEASSDKEIECSPVTASSPAQDEKIATEFQPEPVPASPPKELAQKTIDKNEPENISQPCAQQSNANAPTTDQSNADAPTTDQSNADAPTIDQSNADTLTSDKSSTDAQPTDKQEQVTDTPVDSPATIISIGPTIPASPINKSVEQPATRTEPSEQQTARKTVPPIKIKVRGYRRKTYMVEPSIEFTLTSKKRPRGKSGNKSESSDSEKKLHHHHHNKRKKSPTSDLGPDNPAATTVSQMTVAQGDEPMKKSHIPTGAYEANFLEFIQSKDKQEDILAVSDNAKTMGKPYKVDADGSLTDTALVSSGTTTSTKSDKLMPSTNVTDLTRTNLIVSDKISEPIENAAFLGYKDTIVSGNIKNSITDLIAGTMLPEISEEQEFQKSSLGDMQFICSYCGKVYQSGETILNHFKEMHPGDKIMYKHVADIPSDRHLEHLAEKDRSGHGNIFDRISELFPSEEMQQTKKELLQMGKTSAEADSTTEIEASAGDDEETANRVESEDVYGNEMDSKSSNGAESSTVTMEKDSNTKSSEEYQNEDPPFDGDGNEDDDNESSGSLNLKIVDVVSLKDQFCAIDECDMSEKMEMESHNSIPPVSTLSMVTPVSSISDLYKSHELKIPHYPRNSPNNSIQDQINQQKQIFQKKKEQQAASAAANPKKNSRSERLSNTFKCEKCNVHAPLLAAMVAHLRNCHKEIPRLFQCPYCRDMEAENEAKIHQHIRLHHPTDNPNPPVALSEPAKRNLKTLAVKLPDNVKIGDGNLIEKDIYMCLKCKVHMPSLEMIYAHLEQDHTEVFVFVCPFCKTFKSKSEEVVNQHLMATHQRTSNDINISLAIDGNQFIRVPCLIKDKKNSNKTNHPTQSAKPPHIQSAHQTHPPLHTQQQQKPPIHSQTNQQIHDPNLRFSQADLIQSAPIDSYGTSSTHTTSIYQSTQPKQAGPTQNRFAAPGTKKKKSLLDSIQQLTMQKQMEQQGLHSTSSNSGTSNSPAIPSHPSQLGQALPSSVPPPLIRGPPPLIRYDQLGKMQQYVDSTAVGQSTRASALFGNDMAVSAAQRLQSLNIPKSVPVQSLSAPKQIQSSLFDTSDPDTFKPVNRKPVLNVPMVPRANRVPFHHNMPSQSPQTSSSGDVVLDLSTSSTPSASPIPQNLQSPPPQGSTPPVPVSSGINPEVFKVFNLKPTTQAQLPRGLASIQGAIQQLGQHQIMLPQQVRPNTTSTLAYRPPVPHVVATSQAHQVINMPMGALIGNVIVSIANTGIPQGFQAVHIPGAPTQFIRVSVPHQVVTQAQTMQAMPITRPGLVTMGQPRGQNVLAAGPPNQQIMNLNLPMFKCPYCPKVIPLTLAEVQPHIESQHHGSSIVFMQIDNH